MVSKTEYPKLDRLYEKYGIAFQEEKKDKEDTAHTTGEGTQAISPGEAPDLPPPEKEPPEVVHNL